MVRRVQNKGLTDDDEINEIIVRTIMECSGDRYIPLAEKQKLVSGIFASMRGLDVLQELIDDTSITEIMVNGSDDIFVEQAGTLSRRDLCFDTRENMDDVVQKIAHSRRQAARRFQSKYDTSARCHKRTGGNYQKIPA